MKGVVSPQLAPVAGPPARPRNSAVGIRKWIARRTADAWLNLLFWHARHAPRFVRRSKPLWVWGAWTCSPFIRNNTLANARRLLGPTSTPAQRERLGKSVVANFYDFVCDVGRSVGASPEQLRERIDGIEGHGHYLAARERKKGVIVVTAHMGSFEVGMAALRDLERRVHVLFRRDAVGLFEQTRSAVRRQMGVVEACVDDGLSAWVRLREALGNDEAVLIQGDRVMPGQRGRRMPFRDGHVLIPSGPVKLAVATGAPILPIFSVRRPDGRVRLFVEPAIDAADEADADRALEQLTAVIERYVSRYPDQWLMIHRAWCEDAESTGPTDP